MLLDVRLMETTFNEKPVITGRGGFRPNAGRPKGAKNLVGLKKSILEHTSPQELKNMVQRAKKMAKNDKVVLMWYLEQVFGKAKAPLGNQAPPTTNIALFLDKLEKEPNYPIHIENYGTGQETAEQIVEDYTPLPNQEQAPTETPVPSEQSPTTFQLKYSQSKYNIKESPFGVNNI